MSEAILLMHGNMPVLKVHMDEGVYEILNDMYLPYQLKGKVTPISESDINTTPFKTLNRSILKNQEAFVRYLASRVLPLTRENAKKIYSLFGFNQLQDEYSKMDIAIICRAVSLQDNFWLKNESDTVMWEDVNLRTNSLSETVAQVSLHGTSLTLQGKVHTPELNGHGAYAKAWKREPDGLYLHKVGAKDSDIESHIEVMTSNILDKCNVYHIQYFDSSSLDRYTCKCKCMSTERLSMLPGMDFQSYCNVHEMNAERELLMIDANNLYKMWIVDYLISNRDRHGMNWGLYYDSSDMRILGMHPLFDHNNAFDTELMKDKDAPYLYDNNRTMRESAKYAIKRTNFCFTEPISKKDFLTTEMYDSFRERSDDIGVKVSLNEPKFYMTQNVAEVIAEEEKQKHLSRHDGHRKSFAKKMTQAECLSSENLARQCDHHGNIESDYEDR